MGLQRRINMYIYTIKFEEHLQTTIKSIKSQKNHKLTKIDKN